MIRSRRKNAVANKKRWRGVYKMRVRGIAKYRAQFCMKRRVIHLGMFDSEKTACYAWDIVSWTYRRDFESLNYPDERRIIVYDKFADRVREVVANKLRTGGHDVFETDN
jgi:hypothetical protein